MKQVHKSRTIVHRWEGERDRKRERERDRLRLLSATSVELFLFWLLNIIFFCSSISHWRNTMGNSFAWKLCLANLANLTLHTCSYTHQCYSRWVLKAEWLTHRGEKSTHIETIAMHFPSDSECLSKFRFYNITAISNVNQLECLMTNNVNLHSSSLKINVRRLLSFVIVWSPSLKPLSSQSLDYFNWRLFWMTGHCLTQGHKARVSYLSYSPPSALKTSQHECVPIVPTSIIQTSKKHVNNWERDT